jgi:hypothetical protein
MKKYIPYLSWISVRLFQVFLLLIAIESSERSYSLGNSTLVEMGDVYEYSNDARFELHEKKAIAKNIEIETGYNGGAIAMSIITCVCLFLIVWIEINFSKRNQDKNRGQQEY